MKKFDVTVTTTGSIIVEAETKEDAFDKVLSMSSKEIFEKANLCGFEPSDIRDLQNGHYCEDHFSIRIEEVKVEDEYGVNEFDNSTDASENYKKANKILSNVDVTTVAKACSAISTLISNMNIGADYDMLLSEINEKVADILNIGRALKTYGKKKKCPKCGKQLYLSDLPKYDYVCPWCDENF